MSQFGSGIRVKTCSTTVHPQLLENDSTNHFCAVVVKRLSVECISSPRWYELEAEGPGAEAVVHIQPQDTNICQSNVGARALVIHQRRNVEML